MATFREKISEYVNDYWAVPCKDNTAWVYYGPINVASAIAERNLKAGEWAGAFLQYDDPKYGTLEGLYLIKSTNVAAVKGGAFKATAYSERIMLASWYDAGDKNAANPEVKALKPRDHGLNDCAHFVTESLFAGGIDVKTTGVPTLLNKLKGLPDHKILALAVTADAAKNTFQSGVMKPGDVVIYSLTPTDHHHSVVYMGGQKIAMHTWANHPSHPTLAGDWTKSATDDHPLVTLVHFGRDDDSIAGLAAWLPGWWKVMWRGAPYYYFFEKNGKVSYTKKPPARTDRPIALADGKGHWFKSATGLTICWTSTGSVETLVVKSASGDTHLEGQWNGSEKLVADQM